MDVYIRGADRKRDQQADAEWSQLQWWRVAAEEAKKRVFGRSAQISVTISKTIAGVTFKRVLSKSKLGTRWQDYQSVAGFSDENSLCTHCVSDILKGCPPEVKNCWKQCRNQ